ncbi:hypothetical protein GCM10020001_048050 [Nonomuraea salmonea]
MAYVAGVIPQPGDLAYGGFLLVQQGLGHLNPVGAEGMAGVAYIVQAETGFDEDQSFGVGLDQQAVVDGVRGGPGPRKWLRSAVRTRS